MRTRFLPLLVVALAGGCGGNSIPPTIAPPSTTKSSHTHTDGGVAGGALVEWGAEEYHAEFTADHTAGEATVYILDGSAKKVVAIPAKSITLSLTATPPVVVKLDAKPQDGDPAGSSSRFTGKHDGLKKERPFAGSISGEVKGKKYTGDFKERNRSRPFGHQ